MKQKNRVAHAALPALVFLAAWATIACAGPPPLLRPVDYDVDLRLDPSAHTVDARADVTLARIDPARPLPSPLTVDLLLHPDLAVEAVTVDGGRLRSHRRRPGEDDGEDEDEPVTPAVHRLVIDDPEATLRVAFAYRGELHQDVAAGERVGEVHNFEVVAHVGEEGLYLEPAGYWYPRLELPEGGDPALGLAAFRLATDPVDGFELVAGLERQEDGADDRQRWASPFPLAGMVLLGGPLERRSRRHGDVMLHAVLAPGKEVVAEDILDAAAEYLDRYEPLIGRYPFTEFTVLEAFFSSGFAFPTSTQIAGSQLSEYKQYRRHGYLDHELLHNWWGNGVFVDPRDGNWCEGLASYLSNYYGHVLDGDEAAARKQRRNQSNFLSSVAAEDDKPLGTFGRDGGASRGIGYDKGAAVFHMLERKIGFAALSAGLRQLTAERMGSHASWRELEEAFEDAAGVELDGFFAQWVRGRGAPRLALVAASWRPGDREARVTISQEPGEFALDVPLRLDYGERHQDVVVAMAEAVEEVRVPTEPAGLVAVELDPDYHLFRKLEPEEVMPTSALTRRAETLIVLLPDGELAAGYQTVIDAYERAVLGEEDDPHDDRALRVVTAGEATADELEASAVVILGDAVRSPVAAELLARTRNPVTWGESGFSVAGEEYAEPGQAVFLTVHHPSRSDDGVTVYYGNSPAALANARVLGYYPNSLLVFESPLAAAEEPADGMPPSRVLRRLDFEFPDRIELGVAER